MNEGDGVIGGRRGKLGDDADRLCKALQGGQYSILRREVTSNKCITLKILLGLST